MKLLYVTLPDGEGAAVILNGYTIYHEDNERGYWQNFGADEVATRTGLALGIRYQKIELTWNDVDHEEWNFDDVNKAALEMTKGDV